MVSIHKNCSQLNSTHNADKRQPIILISSDRASVITHLNENQTHLDSTIFRESFEGWRWQTYWDTTAAFYNAAGISSSNFYDVINDKSQMTEDFFRKSTLAMIVKVFKVPRVNIEFIQHPIDALGNCHICERST